MVETLQSLGCLCDFGTELKQGFYYTEKRNGCESGFAISGKEKSEYWLSPVCVVREKHKIHKFLGT